MPLKTPNFMYKYYFSYKIGVYFDLRMLKKVASPEISIQEG